MKTRDIKILAVLALCVLGCLVYSNIFANSFHYDDFPQILDNQSIKNIWNLHAIWNHWPTRFVTFFSFALNYHFGGFNLVGFHLFSLFVHIASAVLVFILADLIFNARWPAFCASAIFLTHPIQTEPVNYLVQRGVLLAAFFYLASLILYIKARLIHDSNSRGWVWKGYYVGALLAAILAMLSKEMSASLPLCICLFEAFFLKSDLRKCCKMVIPFFMVSLLIPLLSIHSLNILHLPKAAEDYSGVSAGQYFLTQFRVKVTYLRLLVLPLKQSIVYDYPLTKSILEFNVLLSAAILIFIVGIGLKLRKNSKIISFGIFWFFITLLPESSIVPIQNLMCEYRLYLPMVGFSLALSGGIFGLFKDKMTLAVRLLSVLIMLYAVLSYQRNKVWADEFALWNDAVHNAPQNQMAYLNRGVEYHKRGKLDLAMADYNMVIGLGPVTAVTLSNRGEIFKAKGDLKLALANFDLAIKINPSYVGTYINRGRLYEMQGKSDLALADYKKAITLKPDLAGVLLNK